MFTTKRAVNGLVDKNHTKGVMRLMIKPFCIVLQQGIIVFWISFATAAIALQK
jgi:hypothetical protein